MSRSHKQRDRNRVQHQRHKAMQLRDIAQQAIHRFIERLQERFAWSQETFHTPAIGAQWLFDEACFWIEELLHRIGLSGSKLRRKRAHEFAQATTSHRRDSSNRKRPSSRRDRMLIESLEPRVVLAGAAEMLVELGFDSSAISTIRNFGNDSFFVASTYDHGRELWKLDSGSPAGIRLVADINPGRASSNPTNLTDLGGTLYFSF